MRKGVVVGYIPNDLHIAEPIAVKEGAKGISHLSLLISGDDRSGVCRVRILQRTSITKTRRIVCERTNLGLILKHHARLLEFLYFNHVRYLPEYRSRTH